MVDPVFLCQPVKLFPADPQKPGRMGLIVSGLFQGVPDQGLAKILDTFMIITNMKIGHNFILGLNLVAGLPACNANLRFCLRCVFPV